MQSEAERERKVLESLRSGRFTGGIDSEESHTKGKAKGTLRASQKETSTMESKENAKAEGKVFPSDEVITPQHLAEFYSLDGKAIRKVIRATMGTHAPVVNVSGVGPRARWQFRNGGPTLGRIRAAIESYIAKAGASAEVNENGGIID